MAKKVRDPTSRAARFGFFEEPVGRIDPDDFDIRSPMGRLLDDEERRNEFRQFQFLGAISESVVVGCALTRTHKSNSAFAYIYRPSDQAFHEIRLRSKSGVTMSFDPDDGRLIGVNVSRGVNETSFSENCFWVDGVRTPLGGMHFEFDSEALEEPWQISETTGPTRLTFTPAHVEFAARRHRRASSFWWASRSSFHRTVCLSRSSEMPPNRIFVCTSRKRTPRLKATGPADRVVSRVFGRAS